MNPSDPTNSLSRQQVLDSLRETMLAEAQAISHVAGQLDEAVVDAVELLQNCSGRVIVTGMGKMSAIARKCSATFCSTGTPAIFLHPAEALHGDLGIVSEQDVVLVLSYSGETDEINELIPHLRRHGVPVISISGNMESQLAKRSQVVIPIQVKEEADPISVAPTCSTTVCLSVCDALAVALMKIRGFTSEQFAIYHPGGNLGRKLLLTVEDLMAAGDKIPIAKPDQTLRESLVQMSQKSLGAVLVVDEQSKLVGIFTDGDLRRSLERNSNPLADPIESLMSKSPFAVSASDLAAESMKLMEENSISVLPVVDTHGQVEGILHIHHLVQAGLA